MKILDLMCNFDQSSVHETSKLTFIGVEGYDVYNITAPFKDENNTVIAGRVEKRDSENSYVYFFNKVDDNTYKLLKDYPKFHLQDPYFTFIKGELVLGGTEIFTDPLNPRLLSYRAIKLKGKNIKSLVEFFKGPERMKDIRLKELFNNQILCLTRPQGDYGGRGQIGYLIVDNLEELTISAIQNAPLLNSFVDGEWGGANEIYNISDSEVGVLGHIAKFDEEKNRHYYAISFIFNFQTKKYYEEKFLLKRENLIDGPTKRNDLIDVIFSGGLINLDQKFAEIYVGVSDCQAHRAVINNPFYREEEKK